MVFTYSHQFIKMNQNKIIGTAAVLGALSVAIGAFGAHGLEGLVEAGKLTDHDLKTFETGVRYQFYHTFALLAVGLGYHMLNAKMAKFATTLFLIGVIIFSGSLYRLLLSEPLLGTRLSWLGAITPLGGLSFIAGWFFLFRSTKK